MLRGSKGIFRHAGLSRINLRKRVNEIQGVCIRTVAGETSRMMEMEANQSNRRENRFQGKGVFEKVKQKGW